MNNTFLLKTQNYLNLYYQISFKFSTPIKLLYLKQLWVILRFIQQEDCVDDLTLVTKIDHNLI